MSEFKYPATPIRAEEFIKSKMGKASELRLRTLPPMGFEHMADSTEVSIEPVKHLVLLCSNKRSH